MKKVFLKTIPVCVFLVIWLSGKAFLVKTDSSIRAHTAAVAGYLQGYYKEHGELPHVLGEANFFLLVTSK